MRGSIADFVDIQEWSASTLKASEEFKQFCIDTIGTELNFFSSFPFREEVKEEDLPAIIFYTEVFDASNISTEDFVRFWTLPFVIQIIPIKEPVNINGVLIWDSTAVIKKIAYKACEVLEETAECGIDNKDIRVIEIEALSTTDIDEADDLQAQIFLKFGQIDTL